MATVPDFAGSATLTSAALNNFVHEVTGSGGTGITDTNVNASANIAISKTALGTYTSPTAWVPTFTAGTGTPTTVTVTTARYTQIGKNVSCYMNFTITNKGTAGGVGEFTLPVTAANIASAGSGYDAANTGKPLIVWLSTTGVGRFYFYDLTTPWVDTVGIRLNINYEAA